MASKTGLTHLEKQVEKFLCERVRAIGGFSIKLAPTEAGIPDRLVLLPGSRMFLVECKAVSGRLSLIQQHWHAKAKRLGITVVVVKNRAEVSEWLRTVVADNSARMLQEEATTRRLQRRAQKARAAAANTTEGE